MKAIFAEPVETSVSKKISHTEYEYKSSYGYNYNRKDGDSKAGAVVFVLDPDGKEMAQYATSKKCWMSFGAWSVVCDLGWMVPVRKRRRVARGNPQWSR
jgi:hypothetical protein